VKIGPVDPKIIWLKLKQEEINASKIFRSGKFAELAKQDTRLVRNFANQFSKFLRW